MSSLPELSSLSWDASIETFGAGFSSSLRASRWHMRLGRFLPAVARVSAPVSAAARLSARPSSSVARALCVPSRLASASSIRSCRTMGSSVDASELATAASVPYHFSSAFDSGNGDLVSCTLAECVVKMRAEPFTEADGRAHVQWFHFRITNAFGMPLKVTIANAGRASYPDGWHHYKCFISIDRKHWVRVQSTSYDEVTGQLCVDFGQEKGGVPGQCVHFAYFVPYSNEQHLDLVSRCVSGATACPDVRLLTLGETNDGRPLDCLRFGGGACGGDAFLPETPFAGTSQAARTAVTKLNEHKSEWERTGGAKRVIWVIARQHPGESMASWWMEGFCARLLDSEDPVTKKLLNRCVLYVVPHMNPDGASRGHLRTNAKGANLNREWADPKLSYAPEVFHVRKKMDETGVDLMLDVHGDEAEPYCFIVGGEGTPGWDDERAATQTRFKEKYANANPDFQTVFPLEYGGAPSGNVVTAKTQIAVRYNAVGMTLEMPFTDNIQVSISRVPRSASLI